MNMYTHKHEFYKHTFQLSILYRSSEELSHAQVGKTVDAKASHGYPGTEKLF